MQRIFVKDRGVEVSFEFTKQGIQNLMNYVKSYNVKSDVFIERECGGKPVKLGGFLSVEQMFGTR